MMPATPMLKHRDFLVLDLVKGREEAIAHWRFKRASTQDQCYEAFRPLGDAYFWYDATTGCRVSKVLQEVLAGFEKIQERP